MAEEHIRLDIPVLLPEVEDERDQCVARLRESLEGNRGIERVHIERQDGQAALCLHYEPNLVSLDQVQRMAQNAGAEISRQFRHTTVHVRGMDCADCAASLEHILGRMPGMVNVSVSYAAEKMRLEFDTSELSLDAISDRVDWMGYTFEPPPETESWLRGHWQLALSLTSGLMLGLGLLSQFVFGFPPTVALIFFLLAYVAGGLDTTRHGLAAAFHLRFDIDFLMVVAAVGAALLGRWAEGAFLLFLFSLGHALERDAMGRARRNIQALGELMPRTARVRRNGEEIERPVEDLQRGDRVVVRPGERIPVDGEVLEGVSAIDQSPVTGESQPVDRGAGDAVFAGSINGQAALVVEVTKLAKDSTLSRVVQMVEDAQTQKSPTQRLTERFSRVYVPAVLTAVALTISVPPLVGWLPLDEAFLRAMTLLVAASPCALAISTPSAVLSGVARAARTGVLIKGGVHLEHLGQVSAIAFDKTGTLTLGRPVVSDVVPFDGWDENGVLALAGAVEINLTHPLARAIADRAESQAIDLPSAADVETIGGRGVQATVNGDAVLLGNRDLFEGRQIEIPLSIAERIEALESQGKSVVLISQGGQLAGLLGLRDLPRPEAQQVMARLRAIGITELVMLTGDHARVAQAVADELGMTNVHSELLPEDKVDAVRQLTETHAAVAMVGDGINDAPAMAQATLGIAMGGAGTDVALESADVALMADDLSKLPMALALGRQARRIIRQNVLIALGVIAFLVPSALFGWASIGPAIVFHEGSTLIVVANALRLLRFRAPDELSPERV
jgi:Cd2+/Zn2+-exporting ATPase